MNYQTSPIKRARRTKRELDELLETILKILDGETGPITLRHLFYRLSGLGAIEKTEDDYKRLCHLTAAWRKAGDIPWRSFTDSTRWYIREPLFDSLADALRNTQEMYRKNLWQTQGAYVEVWVEKAAIAPIVAEVASGFGVGTFVCRGFSSLSSLFSASELFRRQIESGKEVFVYHVGDYDPSGIAAVDSIRKTITQEFGVPIRLERLAVTEHQIRTMKLPSRPVKKSDPRSGKWRGGDSVEVDSMPPRLLKDLVAGAIQSHIIPWEWNALLRAEGLEKETLASLCASAEGGGQ